MKRHQQISGKWSLGSNAAQWILRRNGHAVAFVSSSRDVLARCMREKGVSVKDREILLAGLPTSFGEQTSFGEWSLGDQKGSSQAGSDIQIIATPGKERSGQ